MLEDHLLSSLTYSVPLGICLSLLSICVSNPVPTAPCRLFPIGLRPGHAVAIALYSQQERSKDQWVQYLVQTCIGQVWGVTSQGAAVHSQSMNLGKRWTWWWGLGGMSARQWGQLQAIHIFLTLQSRLIRNLGWSPTYTWEMWGVDTGKTGGKMDVRKCSGW